MVFSITKGVDFVKGDNGSLLILYGIGYEMVLFRMDVWAWIAKATIALNFMQKTAKAK